VLTEDQKVRDRRPIGILSQQGLIRALLDVVNHDMPAGPLRQHLDPGIPTVEEDAGLVLMAELFDRHELVRALAAVRDEKLVGLVLCADVVHAVMEVLSGVEDTEKRLLYLSALRERGETPDFN